VAKIVMECTDAKDLPKMERKQFQVDNFANLSNKVKLFCANGIVCVLLTLCVLFYQAKLVRLADKLYNLRDMTRATPRGWLVL
jgi:guanosine-3',5'-bis(diphosphate) 3'-pyrophosphohydrolase